MMNSVCLKSLLVVTVLIMSCDRSADPEPKPKSSDKEILSFSFSALKPEAIGVINKETHAITVDVPAGVDITNLIPTISISSKSSISPASGTAQNFSSPVEYIVVAEDGSSNSYTISVNVLKTEWELDPDNPDYFIKGEEVTISGTGFPYFEIIKLELIHEQSGLKTELAAKESSSASVIVVEIPLDLPAGQYDVTIVVGSETVVLDEPISVVGPAPAVYSISELSITPPTTIMLTGNNFMDEGNAVFLVKVDDGTLTHLSIASESSTSIGVYIPETTPPGRHQLMIVSNGVQRSAGDVTVYR